jgi:hypothetical protein
VPHDIRSGPPLRPRVEPSVIGGQKIASLVLRKLGIITDV